MSVRVFASCDSDYFHEHAAAWYYSAFRAGYTPIIEVVNPDEKVKNYVERRKMANVHYVTVESPSKAFLCSNRFHNAHKYITDAGLLITDIDCYFQAMPAPYKEDVGLFFRPENPDHMKIAAGIVWYSGSPISLEFAKSVSEHIHQLPDQWFVDQIALLLSYVKFKDEATFFPFTQLQMDWEFQEGTYMWTGKGPRKHENKTYLTKKKEHEEGTE